MRGVESFAYDLIVRQGRVSGRVVLLLRSAERKPFLRLDLTFCFLEASPPLVLPLSVGAGRGGSGSGEYSPQGKYKLRAIRYSSRPGIGRVLPGDEIWFTRR